MNKLLRFTPEPFEDPTEPQGEHGREVEFADEEMEEEIGRRGSRGRAFPSRRGGIPPSLRRPAVPISAPAGSMLPGIRTGRFKPLGKVPPYLGRPIIRLPWLPFLPPAWPIFPIPEPPYDVLPGRDVRRAEPPGGAPIDGQPPQPEPSEAPSEYVRWVQSCLNQVMGLRLPIDGIMNMQTRSAIRSFQERRGLRIDGLVGPETERALVNACKTASLSAPSAQSAGFGPAAAAQPGEWPWAPEAEWVSETVSQRRRRPSSRPAVSSAAAVDRWVLPEEVRAAGEAQHVRYDSPGAWADGRNCTGSYTQGAQELRQYILTHFPGVTTIGGYACRQNTANKAETSVHGVGRALDVMIPRVGGRANSAIGDPIANWLVRNATAIGVQYLIWNRVSWNGHIKAPKDRPYTGPNPHTDHIHVELNHDGAGRKTPWFQRSPNGQPVLPPSPKPVPPAGVNYPPPQGYRVLRGPVPREVVAKAQEILRRPDPIGTQIPLSIGGKDYLFAVEWHKHAPTDRVPEALKRWHRGVTVYERVNGARQQPPVPSAPPGYTPSLTRVRFEPNFAQLASEWTNIRDRLVRPALRGLGTKSSAPSKPASTGGAKPVETYCTEVNPRGKNEDLLMKQLAPFVQKYRGDIPIDFLLGWIAVESAGYIEATTRQCERGYFQLHPEEARAVGVDDPQRLSTDPEYSVKMGIEMVKGKMARAEQLGFARGTDLNRHFAKLLHWLPAYVPILVKLWNASGASPRTWKGFSDFVAKNRNEIVKAMAKQYPKNNLLDILKTAPGKSKADPVYGIMGVDKVFVRGPFWAERLRKMEALSGTNETEMFEAADFALF